jgi:hypothetical protein
MAPGYAHYGTQRVNHWFDGLAMVHAFTFGGGKVGYASRFLRTRAYRVATEEGRMGWRSFATDPCALLTGASHAQYAAGDSQNANVNIGRIAGRVLALGESTPSPHAAGRGLSGACRAPATAQPRRPAALRRLAAGATYAHTGAGRRSPSPADSCRRRRCRHPERSRRLLGVTAIAVTIIQIAARLPSRSGRSSVVQRRTDVEPARSRPASMASTGRASSGLPTCWSLCSDGAARGRRRQSRAQPVVV